MNHAKKNHALMFAAVLTLVVTAVVACSTASTSNPPGTGSSASSTGGTQVASLLQSGLAQAGKDNWSAARANFQNVLAISPGNVYANYDLGVIAQNTGNSNEALNYYDNALATNAVFTPAMYNEAILLESSQPRQAISLYQKIVTINTKAATAYLRMAFLQAEQGDLTDAKANDAKAVSLNSALGKYSLPVKQ